MKIVGYHRVQRRNQASNGAGWGDTDSKSALFSGRVGRSEFLCTYSMFTAILVVTQIYLPDLDWLRLFVMILVAFFQVSLIVQRFHDLGRHGNHFWLLFIPFYNLYLFFGVLFGERGQSGSNIYGDEPVRKRQMFL